jgi:hypothetical protein
MAREFAADEARAADDGNCAFVIYCHRHVLSLIILQ